METPMKPEKFHHDAKTVAKFIEIYCKDKHDEAKKEQRYPLPYHGVTFAPLTATLCEACQETLRYSLARLEACPHEEKPSCRTCPAPCYNPPQWKLLARIMRHSGMKLGLIKLRKLFTKN
jgi:hypothetical protein